MNIVNVTQICDQLIDFVTSFIHAFNIFYVFIQIFHSTKFCHNSHDLKILKVLKMRCSLAFLALFEHEFYCWS